MACVGKVRDVTAEFHFEWQIDDFFSLSEKNGACCNSPSFSFAGESWYFKVYPNGESEDNSVGYVGTYLNRKSDGPPINLRWSLGVKTFEGKIDEEEELTHVFEEAGGYGFPNFLERSDLSERKSELVPSGVLTLVSHIEHYTKYKDGAATKKLVDDLADILESEEHSDVTIIVKDKKFHLHRNILAGRNPYFRSMFNTEMKEKTTGIVSIDDCEPDIFQSFINFLYTGKAHLLSCDNVCALYKVADKYQQDQLKAQCLGYMKNEISVNSFCDFIVLALKHDEKELLQAATDLFCRKIKEIIQSAKWQTFVQEYPIQSNELHIKAVNYYVK